mmetsp:Transcript_31274/g.93894  ORF Transcript_31274/g.93894 Transcript_31274/m.93894 type:complete len:254 (-) Transcript_31274:228-989(-)
MFELGCLHETPGVECPLPPPRIAIPGRADKDVAQRLVGRVGRCGGSHRSRHCRCRSRSGRCLGGLGLDSRHCSQDVRDSLLEGCEGQVKVIVDNHEVEVLPAVGIGESELGFGSGQAPLNLLFGLGTTATEPRLELLHRGRFDKDEARRRGEVGRFDRSNTLHVNVENADLALTLHPRHRRLRRAIKVTVHVSRLNEVAGFDHRRHRFPVGEVVFHTIGLSRPWVSCCVRDGKAEMIGKFFHQHSNKSAFADA